jgi:hypothetical protein
MTPEQINQALRRMQVNETHVNALFGENASLQQRQQILQQLIDGAVTEALTRSQLIHQGEFGKFRSEYDQHQALLNELYREHTMAKFVKDYPELGDYRQFIDDSVAEVSGLPEAPKDMQEYFSRVAQSAASRVKALKPDFALADRTGGAPPPQQTPQTQQSPQSAARPPSYTGPSGPGVGGAVQGGSKKSSVSDIWDEPEA